MVAMTGRRVAAVACAGALAVAVGSASTRAASPSAFHSPCRSVAGRRGPAGRRRAGDRARYGAELHLLGRRRRGARRGEDQVLVRHQARHDPDARDGQGPQHAAGGGPRRGRVGHAERRGPAPHPVHGHLRPRPGLHDLALPGPGHAAAGRREPRLRGRELQWRALRRRRRRCDLRARRAVAHRPLDVHREPLRSERARCGWRSGASAVCVPLPPGGRDRQSLHEPTCAATAAR